MRLLGDKAIRLLVIGYGLLVMVGCTQQPQQVRRLNESQEPDSAMMAQMVFNMQMASAADKVCSDWVQQDSATYALDDFGFWYSKTTKPHSESLLQGEKVVLHLQIREIGGQLVADIKDEFSIGSSDLPICVNRCLRQINKGEQMRIVAPWYTAYGVEGTTLIKPYTNLIITLKIEE